MTPQQRRLIRELVKKYSENIGTESLIAFVAETHGMLATGKTFLQSIGAGDSSSTDWLLRDCAKHKVDLHSFLEEISRVIAIFNPNQDKEDHFTTLGISSGASRDEIKQAYRTLSLRYHPDIASSQDHNNPEKFIEINKAYQAILTAQHTEKHKEITTQKTQWRKNKARRLSGGQKKIMFMWASAALVVLALVSTIASINIKNRAMLAGLQRGRTVSAVTVVPPIADTVPKNIQTEAVTTSNHESQKAAEQKGFAPPSPEQLPPVTIINNARMSDSQKMPIIKESLNTTKTLKTITKIAKKTQEKKLSVVHVTKQHFKSNSAPTATSIHAPADTLPIQKEPKTVSFPHNVNNKQVVAPVVAIEVLPAKPPETVEKKLVQPDIQSRLDIFLDDYIKAYQQRNLILFARFFAADAIENGKPFTSMLPIYSELFATTSDITLMVEKTSWQQLDGKISFKGSFKVHVQYNDSHIFAGSGPIRFILLDNNGFRVSVLEYDFLVP